MVSSSCKHVVNGRKMEVKTTTECTSAQAAVSLFSWAGGGEVGEPELPP